MKTIARKASTFVEAKSATAPLAIRPSALSIFWEWGCGTENVSAGRATIVTIEGPLEQRSSWWDGYDAILERFLAACGDANTEVIVLRFDSPGGECAGLYECVRMMREAKAASGKRVVAYADESAYSAAYALACVADEIYLPASGGVGSVGVIAVCLSQARLLSEIGIDVAVIHAGARKADCHPALPLSDDAIAGVQSDVDALALMFRALVAGARGTDEGEIAALEAGCFMGEEAIAAGLADGVMGFSELLELLNKEEADMGDQNGKKGARGAVVKASEVKEADALARPLVATPDPALMQSVSKAMTGGKPAPAATSTASEEEEESAEGEEDEEEASEEETESSAEGESSEEGDDSEEEEEESDDEEDAEEEEDEEEAKASRSAPTPGTVTSANVLRMVRELAGGSSSPAEQIGALTALRDKAARADKAERSARKASKAAAKSELKSVVAKAVADGKLEPARRAWAMSAGLDVVKGYLATIKEPVAPRTPLRQKTEKGANRKEQSAAGEAVVDQAIANVARTMQMDPKAIAAHADELRKAGLIH